MAVFTEVSFDEAARLIDGLGIGALRELAPCAGGIENTNYFVDTAAGRYVLTLFERLTAEELPGRSPMPPAACCSRSRASPPPSSTACRASTTSRPMPPTAPASAP